MNSAMRLLGYAGLIPFIVLALFPGWIAPYLSQPPVPLFLTYSVIILGFMAGVLWPVLYSAERSLLLALAAVTPPVFSFLAVAFLAPAQVLLVQTVLFAGLRIYERVSGIDARYVAGYRNLRWQLTTVVVFCHLWLWWGL